MVLKGTVSARIAAMISRIRASERVLLFRILACILRVPEQLCASLVLRIERGYLAAACRFCAIASHRIDSQDTKGSRIVCAIASRHNGRFVLTSACRRRSDAAAEAGCPPSPRRAPLCAGPVVFHSAISHPEAYIVRFVVSARAGVPCSRARCPARSLCR